MVRRPIASKESLDEKKRTATMYSAYVWSSRFWPWCTPRPARP